VGLPLLLQKQPDDERVREVLEAVGLQGLAHRLPQTLSGGQLQRVAIARALVHRPQLILADEPTGNLDPATAERVMDLLQAQVRTQGAACVLVTHSRAAAERADRVLTLTSRGMVDCAETASIRLPD
jgi:putative ABC transport system ATP-binding protein